MLKYRLPIPPIDEQKRIVSQIDALEQEIAKARSLIKMQRVKSRQY